MGAAAVVDVTDLTNLGSEQYLLQAGGELVTDIFVDTSQSPIGASYSGSGAFDVLRNFETRWRFSSSLRAKAAEYSLVHLISGKNLPADPGVLGIAFVSAACEGSAVAVSWVSLLDSEPDACKVALIMHENGHTFSLEHVNDRSAVMNPRNTCSLISGPSRGPRSRITWRGMSGIPDARVVRQQRRPRRPRLPRLLLPRRTPFHSLRRYLTLTTPFQGRSQGRSRRCRKRRSPRQPSPARYSGGGGRANATESPRGASPRRRASAAFARPRTGASARTTGGRPASAWGPRARGPAARRGARAFRRRRRRPARTLRKSSSELTGWSLCTR